MGFELKKDKCERRRKRAAGKTSSVSGKNSSESSFLWPVRKAEPVGCVSLRFHLFPREEGCQAAIVTPCFYWCGGFIASLLVQNFFFLVYLCCHVRNRCSMACGYAGHTPSEGVNGQSERAPQSDFFRTTKNNALLTSNGFTRT